MKIDKVNFVDALIELGYEIEIGEDAIPYILVDEIDRKKCSEIETIVKEIGYEKSWGIKAKDERLKDCEL